MTTQSTEIFHILDSELFRKNTAAIVIGKGPSYDPVKYYCKYAELGGNVTSISINHKKVPDVDFVFCNDMESALSVSPYGISPLRLVLPMYPHWYKKPQGWSLEEIAPRLWYKHMIDFYYFDLFTAPKKHHNSYPVFNAKVSTYESVLTALALAGKKDIYTIGIDGGNKYHGYFDNYRLDKEAVYDYQFETENRLKQIYNLNVERL